MKLNVDKKSTTDVLILGGGAAGTRAALAARKEGSSVTLMEKGVFSETGSSFTPYALGWGYRASVFNPDKDHFQDIIDAGLGLTDRQLAETLVNKAPERLEDLKDYGIHFKGTENGELFHLKGCFASRSYAMVANKMKNVKCVFYQKAVNCGCDILDHTCALDIEKNDDGTFSFLAQRFNSEYLEIKAKSIVLATGGGSSIYKYNLNQPGQVGDGYHLGLKLGAKTINMEFIQM